jgi:ParB-like chromosome segregation protein Spo0J
LLREARPGGLARQQVLTEGAYFVDEQAASVHGAFLANVPDNEQVLFERRIAIVGGEVERLIARGVIVHSQADDTLYSQDVGVPVLRYVARADIQSDIPGLERHTLEGVHELAESINKQGLLHPILLATTDGQVYHLAAGHRRLAAHEQLDSPYILARVWAVDDDDLHDVVITLREHENLWTQPLTEEQQAQALAQHQADLEAVAAADAADLIARGKELRNYAQKRVRGPSKKGGNAGVTTKRDNSRRSAQQLAKEKGISVRAARDAIALSELQERLEARTKRKRWGTEHKDYVPGTMVMLTAMNLLGQIQGASAEERLAVSKAALKTIKQVEHEDYERWRAETHDGTQKTAAQIAKEKEAADNHDSDSAKAALLARRGRSLPDIARKLNIRPERAEQLVAHGETLLPPVNKSGYHVGQAQPDEMGLPHEHGWKVVQARWCETCGQMEVQA